MQKLRQVLRFYSQGKGTKTISSIVGISRNTVKKYLQIFHTFIWILRMWWVWKTPVWASCSP